MDVTGCRAPVSAFTDTNASSETDRLDFARGASKLPNSDVATPIWYTG